LVTIPCACVAVFKFGWGLPSLAASCVIGYMVSGAFNSVTLFLSDWEYIAYRVMMQNGATAAVDVDDCESESDASDEGGGGVDESSEDKDTSGRWSLFNYMSVKRSPTGLLRTQEDPDGLSKMTNFLKIEDDLNASLHSVRSWKKTDPTGLKTDPTGLDESTGTANSDMAVKTKKTASTPWWASFGRNDEEDNLRTVVLGPGKFGYAVQSTSFGCMIVGSPYQKDTTMNGMILPLASHRMNPGGQKAEQISGELFYGDVILEIDKVRCDSMSGKEVAQLLNKKRKQKERHIVVSHREGTDLGTFYQPGVYGSHALGPIKNRMLQRNGGDTTRDTEFDDDGVHLYNGVNYMNMANFGSMT